MAINGLTDAEIETLRALLNKIGRLRRRQDEKKALEPLRLLLADVADPDERLRLGTDFLEGSMPLAGRSYDLLRDFLIALHDEMDAVPYVPADWLEEWAAAGNPNVDGASEGSN